MLVRRNNARIMAERLRSRMANPKGGGSVVAVAKGKKKDDKKRPAQRKQK